MSEPKTYTFICELTALNDTGAEFTSDRHNARFGMPVAHWLELGRPGVVEVTVKEEPRD